MIDVTIWKAITLYPIVSFFGVFTLASLLLKWLKDSPFQNTYIINVVVATSFVIALLCWISAVIHNQIGLSEMGDDLCVDVNYETSFFLFSTAWNFMVILIFSFLISVIRLRSRRQR